MPSRLSKIRSLVVSGLAVSAPEKFIDKHPFLSNWWKWWDARRSHVFRALKPGFNVAKSNLAEVHHSRWLPHQRRESHLDSGL